MPRSRHRDKRGISKCRYVCMGALKMTDMKMTDMKMQDMVQVSE